VRGFGTQGAWGEEGERDTLLVGGERDEREWWRGGMNGSAVGQWSIRSSSRALGFLANALPTAASLSLLWHRFAHAVCMHPLPRRP
jgi:hypothetical protein